MSDSSVNVSSPALVLVFPKSIGSESDSKSDFSEYEEEHEGSVFVGLKFAMIIYLFLAVGIATAWKLYHLL
jgi:hypothetical protein